MSLHLSIQHFFAAVKIFVLVKNDPADFRSYCSDRIVQYQNEMKILILYGVIGSMATVDSALFSSSSTIRAIKMMVLSLLYISLNRALAKLRVWLKHSAHRPIPISKSP